MVKRETSTPSAERRQKGKSKVIIRDYPTPWLENMQSTIKRRFVNFQKIERGNSFQGKDKRRIG